MLAQTWPLQLLTAVMVLAAGWWFLATGDPMVLRLAWHVEAVAAVGLGAAFAVHEVAHAAALRRWCPGVSHLVVTLTPWRFSLEPRGTITPGQVVRVALAGPGAAASVGVLLWVAIGDAGLHWWFLAHLVFLLPLFGDGRSLALALGSIGADAVHRSRALKRPS